MKVAVSSLGSSLDSQVNPRFGRSSLFIVVDIPGGKHTVLYNKAVDSPGGAGVQTARLLADYGVKAVVAGYIGPHAIVALKANGIEVYTGVEGSVRDAIAMIEQGKLKPAEEANAQLHSGLRNF